MFSRSKLTPLVFTYLLVLGQIDCVLRNGYIGLIMSINIWNIRTAAINAGFGSSNFWIDGSDAASEGTWT